MLMCVCDKLFATILSLCMTVHQSFTLVTGAGSDCMRITTPCQDQRKQHAPPTVVPERHHQGDSENVGR